MSSETSKIQYTSCVNENSGLSCRSTKDLITKNIELYKEREYFYYHHLMMKSIYLILILIICVICINGLLLGKKDGISTKDKAPKKGNLLF